MSRSSSAPQVSVGDIPFCYIVLENLVQKVNESHEKVSPEVTKSWKEKIVTLAKEATVLIKQQDENKRLISEIENKQLQLSQHDNLAGKLKEVNEIFKKRVQEYDPEKDPEFKRLKNQVIPNQNDDDDLIVSDVLTESDFKCPYMGTVMTAPMKNTACIHHMDKQSLDACLKNTSKAKCPKSGCNAFWTATTSSLDTLFQLRIQRYQQNNNRNTQILSQINESKAVDIDEE